MSAAVRTIEQIVADHSAIIGRILDREVPGNLTADQFIALVEEGAEFTDRLFGSYMEHATEDLGAVATYLGDALAVTDGPAKQILLDAAHQRLHALDPNEFLY